MGPSRTTCHHSTKPRSVKSGICPTGRSAHRPPGLCSGQWKEPGGRLPGSQRGLRAGLAAPGERSGTADNPLATDAPVRPIDWTDGALEQNKAPQRPARRCRRMRRRRMNIEPTRTGFRHRGSGQTHGPWTFSTGAGLRMGKSTVLRKQKGERPAEAWPHVARHATPATPRAGCPRPIGYSGQITIGDTIGIGMHHRAADGVHAGSKNLGVRSVPP